MPTETGGQPLAERGAWYLEAGYTVVPLEPLGYKAIGAPTRSKEELAGYIVATPDANIGLQLPPGSIAITVEKADGAAVRLVEYMQAAEGRHLPHTKCVHTAHGGIQAIFRTATPPRYVNSNGIHITAAPHYIVAPPSRHPNGNTIRWGNRESRIAQAPEWLVGYLDNPTPAPTAAPQGKGMGETPPAPQSVAVPPTHEEALATLLDAFPGATVVEG